VARPAVPAVKDAAWVRNPIDAFIAAEREERGLSHRPEAPPHVLLRRLHLDLTGLPPPPEDLHAFLADPAPDAHDRAVEKLLASPQHGERWARHWMDVWRYSDWAGWGNQIRDSQPHIWRWRDWIIESLNADRGYDRMVVEMLAGDELAPLDPATLRATGYLARSFKLLSREAWMQETVDHAAQAFLGVTAGCARCHEHMYDPIAQEDYYRLRAVFEPIGVRIDPVPGELDPAKDGLARAFDSGPDAKTYLFERGDDRKPVKDRALEPGVPAALGGPAFVVQPVSLPLTAHVPEKAEQVIRDTLAASERAAGDARAKFEAALLKAVQTEAAAASAAEGEPRVKAGEAAVAARAEAELAELDLPLAAARHASLAATIAVERIEDAGEKDKDPERWKQAATAAAAAQRWLGLLESRRNHHAAEQAAKAAEGAVAAARRQADEKKGDKGRADAAAKAESALKEAHGKLAEAEKALAAAKAKAIEPPSTEYAPRPVKKHPESSTGRRLAFARWVAHRDNPLAARVAVNHIWRRYFGQGLVATPADFGSNGSPPSHPALLDWLAAELMEPSAPGVAPWSLKHIHRLIVESSTYRMASTPDPADLAADPDNIWLWRMPSRRLEAEAVRDGVLAASGRLDAAFGGPELDQQKALATRRRSIYYRHAPEKQPEFLRLFDMAAPGECYQRKTSVVPQQALALANSELSLTSARGLARALAGEGDEAFVRTAFASLLSRVPTREEMDLAARFLQDNVSLFERQKDSLPAGGAGGDLSKPAAAPAVRARENFVHALLNHNDFVTVR
jgi:hypothetical protein